MRPSYDNATEARIAYAYAKRRMGKKLTRADKLLLLLEDGSWHDGKELAEVVSHRFSGYLFTLKQEGVNWTKRRNKLAPKGERWYQYKLVDRTECEGQMTLV